MMKLLNFALVVGVNCRPKYVLVGGHNASLACDESPLCPGASTCH